MSFKIGADPEFVFSTSTAIVKADTIIPATQRESELGFDGHPYTAEIRPKPATTPRELVRSIRSILLKAKETMPKTLFGPKRKYAWIGGSYIHNRAIGGHIHFSGVVNTDLLVFLLDSVLAPVVALLEDPSEARSRKTTAYGSLSDVRNKAWGFEYRTLASFVVSPQVSLAVYAIAKACAMAVDDDQKFFSGMSLRRVNSLAPDRRRFSKHDVAYLIERLSEIEPLIRNLGYFKTREGSTYTRYVDLLITMARRNRCWHDNRDILQRWWITQTTPHYITAPVPAASLPPIPNEILPAQQVVEAFTTFIQNNEPPTWVTDRVVVNPAGG